MKAENVLPQLLRSSIFMIKAASYSDDVQTDVDMFLAAEVYNLFIVATVICLFVWLFRIALKERHIRELTSHLMSNNALIFDLIGTDVDILKQFTPEHLMKYLEYNSGCEPIPIEQITVPFVLNRESLQITNLNDNQNEVNFKVDSISKFSLQLFWAVPASVYKKCCKNFASLICDNDPTFRRSFMNPFLTSGDATSASSFYEVLETLQQGSRHGFSPADTASTSRSFHYPIPQSLLDELGSYHLDGASLAVFNETEAHRPAMQYVSSQTNLLRPFVRPALYNSLTAGDIPAGTQQPVKKETDSARRHSEGTPNNDILPLVAVIWKDDEQSLRQASQNSGMRSNQGEQESRSCPTVDPAGNGKSLASEERRRLLVRPAIRNESSHKLIEALTVKKGPKPIFAQIAIIHFLRNRIPTMIRRLNICSEGVFIPRSIYLSNGTENQKSNECIICFSNPNDVILLPCRHKLVCRFCVCMIKRCPLCRGAINYYLTEGEEKDLGHSYNTEALM